MIKINPTYLNSNARGFTIEITFYLQENHHSLLTEKSPLMVEPSPYFPVQMSLPFSYFVDSQKDNGEK